MLVRLRIDELNIDPYRISGSLYVAFQDIRDAQFLTDVTTTSISDRVKFKPWGIDGGGEGLGNYFFIDSPDGPRPMKSKDFQRAKAGEALCIHTTGAGGYGPASDRDPEKIRIDVADEKISSERARKVYGWDGNPPENDS